MLNDPVVIASYARTPMGGFQGCLSGLNATQLGGHAVRAALTRSSLTGDLLDKIIMGCVLAAGLGQAPARQAAFAGGLPTSVEATTVNKMCGSGMQSVIFAHDMLATGNAQIIVAGGMESMSNAPYLLAKHRAGARIGHDVVKDSLFFDGLEDAYSPGKVMGTFAEEAAGAFGFGREAQDHYAIESLRRARAAMESGAFGRELIPVEITDKATTAVIETDEQPGNARAEKITGLKPAFGANGTITAANASSISDGAAALVMLRMSVAERVGVTPVARIVGHAVHAQDPSQFPTAPAPAIRKLLEKIGWALGSVDLVEVNEAFAVVALIAMRQLSIQHDILNVNGGATALGHPIGASGARIITTLLGALQNGRGRRGVASICIGGGEATAVALELI